MMDDCRHSSRIVVFKEGSLDAAHKVVTLCQDCGRFYVSVSGDLQDFDLEFKLTTPEMVMSAAESILTRHGLRIVSAADSDTITAQKQAEEAAKRRILDAENQRDAVARALDEYLASKRDQD